MPRKRDPKRDEAKNLWLKNNGDLKLVDLAQRMEVTPNTIRKWKTQDKWDDELKGSAPIPKKSAPKRPRGHPGGQPGNKNAKGHGPPKGNSNAVTHGFFAKFLPAETLEIMESMKERSSADLIWDQIQIQYAAIIRAQRIMFVHDQDDITKEIKKEKRMSSDNMDVEETEWEIQFAWDKHATFLNAQSRAMSELRSLIKQFNDMASEDDERKLKLEQMQLNVEKLRIEVKTLGGDTENDAHAQNSDYEKALNAQAEDVFSDEDVDGNG